MLKRLRRSCRAGLSCLLAAACAGVLQAQTKPRIDPGASRRDARVVARNTAAEVRAPMSEVELAIALRVHAGRLPCELGQTVQLTPDPAAAGYFTLVHGKSSYRVSPEETSTGAIRLEDKAAGIVWLQLANKSMLMDQKLGRRLADECQSPEQVRVAQAMLVNPPISLLDNVAPTSVNQVVEQYAVP